MKNRRELVVPAYDDWIVFKDPSSSNNQDLTWSRWNYAAPSLADTYPLMTDYSPVTPKQMALPTLVTGPIQE